MISGRFAAWVVAILLSVSLVRTADASSYTNSFTTFTNNATILGTSGWSGGEGTTASVATNSYLFVGDYATNLTHYVVFEGEVSNVFARIVPDATNSVFVQLLTQMEASETMPEAATAVGKQGGLCVSNGWPFALSAAGWIRLSDTNAVGAITTISNQWVKLGFEFNYTGGTGSEATNVFYRVLVNGRPFWPHDSALRYSRGSPFDADPAGLFLKSPSYFTPGSEGVTAMTFSGSGLFDEVYSGEPNDAPPLSSRIAITALATTNGLVVVEFSTVGETMAGQVIRLRVLRDGTFVDIGTAVSQGVDSTYQVTVAGLEAGGSYIFQVVDESGRTHTSGEVTVGSFQAQVMVAADGVTLQWSSQPGASYYIERATALGGTWVRLNDEPIVGGAGGVTARFVEFDPLAPTSFFRIVRE